MMKRIVSLACSATVFVGFTLGAMTYDAGTNYVNCKLGDYTGHNGSTPELAYETIQQAVDAAKDNSTIIVYPGDYNKGVGRGETSTHWWARSRIHLGGKSLYIRSLEGRDVTHIVGQLGPAERGYLGDRNDLASCSRCIDIEIGPDSTKEIIIEGFTLRDGATNERAGEFPGHGAAFLCGNGSVPSYCACLVDCVISNCYGSSSVVYGGSLVRCLVTKNDMSRSPIVAKGEPALFTGCHVLNSLVIGNDKYPTAGAATAGNMPIGGGCRFCNTSFVNNRTGIWCSSGVEWYNSLRSHCDFYPDDGAGTHLFNHVVDSRTNRILMAPLLGDVRVRKEGLADGTGDAAYLADTDLFPLPASVDRFKDCFGKSIPSEGAINVGCSQTTAEPKGGCILAGDTNVIFDDSGKATSYHQGYVYTDTYPATFRTTAAEVAGKKLRYFYYDQLYPDDPSAGITGVKTMRHPNLRGELWSIVPPGADQVLVVNASYEGNFVYADPDADPGVADGSDEHPYATLQDAIEALAGTGMVLAKPGVYTNGCGTTGDGMKARIWLHSWNILVRGLEGPEKTIVVGEPDPDTKTYGSGAMLAVAMTSAGAIQGLTLTGAYSGEGDWTGSSGRGPIYSYGNDLLLCDCIITNNTGKNYSVGTGYFERCLIADNHGGSGVSIDGKFMSCVIANNANSGASTVRMFGDWDAYATWLMSCTVVGDGAHEVWRHRSGEGRTDDHVVNSIVDGAFGPAGFPGRMAGNVCYGFSDAAAGSVMANPLLCDAPANDVRPFSLSPVRTAATKPAGAGAETFWWFVCPMDVHGNPWRFDAEGRPIAGAEQEIVSGGAFVAPGNGGFSIMGGHLGLNELEPGATLTLGMAAGATRPLAGIIVNDETNLFSRTALTVAFTMGSDDAMIVPYYSNAWCVDAENGSDTDGFGYNEGSAFKTLKRALGDPRLVAGDRVVALPGTYRDEPMSIGDGYAVKARAVVPANITLESRDGSAVTFIEGRPSDVDDHSNTAGYNDYIHGMGRNAIRGVYLNENAVLRGFTVTNCYVRGAKDDGSGGHASIDHCGAGVAGSSGRAERCTFVDCHAFRGGGAYGTPVVDCVFHDNLALYGGGATTDTSQYGCLSYGNVCAGNWAWGGFFYWKAVDNCTVADSVGGCSSGKGYAMRNTLVTGYIGNWDVAPTSQWFTNCVVDVAKTVSAAYMTAIAGGVGCIVTNAAALQVDADFRPVVGANVAIDRADETISRYVADTDLLGGQRVYNGRRDVGALEADWRPVYAKDVRRNGFDVTAASPDVVETPGRTVSLADGAALSAVLAVSNGKDYSLRAKVTGSGTLTVRVDGEETVYGAGDVVIRFENVTAAKLLDFAYAGEGSAELLGLRCDSGTLIFVR